MRSEAITRFEGSVPFLDLQPSHADLAEAVLDDVARLIEHGTFTNGPQVGEFEEAFATYCGTDVCVGMASGLDALRIALLAAGLKPGDEVIVPAMTFVATVEAIVQASGRPVLVDINEHDYCIDSDAAAAAIGPRTRCVLPVHLYGQMADMRALESTVSRHDLHVLEDACQAHGARRDGFRAGTVGFAGAFSFYPAKNLGAFGDGGALVTSDRQLAARARALREHGQHEKYRHELEGYTARLDTMQALVLLHKLPLLDDWNHQRLVAAERYSASLEGVGDLQVPEVPDGSEPSWHLYVVRTSQPDLLAAHLTKHGISTGRHYPEPVHLAAAYSRLGYRAGAFPVAEALAAEALSLPIFPGISEEQVDLVVRTVGDYFRGG